MPDTKQVAALREHVRSVNARMERLAGQLAGAETRARELQARLEAAVTRRAAQEQAGRDAEAAARARVSAAEVGLTLYCSCCVGAACAMLCEPLSCLRRPRCPL